MMGFSVEGNEETSGQSHRATFDLTPFRERDKKLKEQKQQEEEESAKRSKSPKKSPQKKMKQTVVHVEDRKITEVKFNE